MNAVQVQAVRRYEADGWAYLGRSPAVAGGNPVVARGCECVWIDAEGNAWELFR